MVDRLRVSLTHKSPKRQPVPPVNAVETAGVPVLDTLAEKESKAHEGKFVSTGQGKLVITGRNGGNEQTFMVPASAIITLDGKSAKLTELMKGDSVKVTTGVEDNVTAVAETRAKS